MILALLRPSRLLGMLALLGTFGVVSAEAKAPDLDVASVTSYCSIALETDRMGRPASGYELLPNEEQYRIAKQLAEIAKPLVEAQDRFAPDEVKADTSLTLSGVKEVAETGDFRILGLRGGQKPYEDEKLGPRAKEISTAIRRLHDFNVRYCSWQNVPVDVVEYQFKGTPAVLKHGLTSFEFKNAGTGPHEMNIQKLETDAPISDLMTEVAADDALRQQGPSDAPQVDFRKGRTELLGESFAPSGANDYLVLDLKPGRYVLVCFVPQGTVYESEEHESLGGGTAHALLGMVNEFKVE